MDKLIVQLVTTWDQPCGIAEHSWYLKQAVEAADAGIQIIPYTNLDPDSLRDPASGINEAAVLHLNYQAALHSRWTPEKIREWQWCGAKILVTFHDTGVPNSEQCLAICGAADAAIIHEPCEDLPTAHYWRMGVPDWETPRQYAGRSRINLAWPTDSREVFKGWHDQPVLGSIGFPFGWKHYDQLAKVTAQVGWALLLIAPTATPAQVAYWRSLNPNLLVRTDFVPRWSAISYLAGCDATAFCYVCHNTGQSAAILQGVAARKPVIALETCRQFRALALDKVGGRTIRWAQTFDELGEILRRLPLGRVDPATVALAEQDAWRHVGAKYAQVYRALAGGQR